LCVSSHLGFSARHPPPTRGPGLLNPPLPCSASFPFFFTMFSDPVEKSRKHRPAFFRPLGWAGGKEIPGSSRPARPAGPAQLADGLFSTPQDPPGRGRLPASFPTNPVPQRVRPPRPGLPPRKPGPGGLGSPPFPSCSVAGFRNRRQKKKKIGLTFCQRARVFPRGEFPRNNPMWGVRHQIGLEKQKKEKIELSIGPPWLFLSTNPWVRI